MAFSRHLGVIGILSVSWFVAVGCGDDGDKNVAGDGGEAGEGGEGPNGGKSTSGGSANNAGKGGNAAAGKGGTAGGGMPAAGSGGTAGSATIGGAGAAGGDDAGGAGGVPGPGPGGAGAGGVSAGAGGDEAGGAGGAPAAIAKSCGNECEIDADCTKPDAPSQKCDQVSHRCYNASPAECTSHAECIPGASVWFTNCATDGECAIGESCVAVGDVGYCAAFPVQDTCEFGLEPTTMARFGAQGNVIVCANTYSRCRAGACDSLNCADPLFEGLFCVDSGGGDSCNADTGLCECTGDAECKSGVCGADKKCAACATNQDCVDKGALTGWDTCVNGSCGCSSASVCPDLTQAGVPVCE